MNAPELSDLELRSGFDQFVQASRRLEASYESLRQRADSIDVELAHANARLERTLSEREATLSALPVGVVARDAAGDVAWRNEEAERILASYGSDALDAAEGLRQVGDARIAVRHVALPDDGRLTVLADRSREAELEREVHRLDRLAGLSELAMGIAHEIKNPLNGVMGFASLIERDPSTAERHVGRIQRGLRRIDDIVRALLAFARPDADSELAPLSNVVRQAAADSGAARVTVTQEAAAAVPAHALRRVLSNLFRNSVEASADARIEVRASIAQTRLRVDILDDGPGIPKDLQSRLFDPFVTSKPNGHGLGLALSSRVLAYLDGSLSLGQEGSGAHFIIDLPAAEVTP